jgi:hypothetical protein
MRQRRRLTSSGAWMALAVIAIHLVLSCVHIHPWGVSAQGLATIAASDGSPSPDAPFEPVADGYCAICANIAAFASLDLPGFIRIAAPATGLFAHILLSLSPWPERPGAYRLFQTRAPPSAGNLRSF